MAIQSRYSITPPLGIIFKDNFEGEFWTRKNGGTPTDVVYNGDGVHRHIVCYGTIALKSAFGYFYWSAESQYGYSKDPATISVFCICKEVYVSMEDSN